MPPASKRGIINVPFSFAHVLNYNIQMKSKISLIAWLCIVIVLPLIPSFILMNFSGCKEDVSQDHFNPNLTKGEVQGIQAIAKYYGLKEINFEKEQSYSNQSKNIILTLIVNDTFIVKDNYMPTFFTSHAAFLFYKNIKPEDRKHYDKIIVELDLKLISGTDTARDSYEYTKNILDIFTANEPKLDTVMECIKNLDTNKFLSLCEKNLFSEVTPDSIKKGLQYIDKMFGKIASYELIGIEYRNRLVLYHCNVIRNRNNQPNNVICHIALMPNESEKYLFSWSQTGSPKRENH